MSNAIEKRKERILFLLQEFKDGRKNYAETFIEIERIYAESIGFVSLYDLNKD